MASTRSKQTQGSDYFRYNEVDDTDTCGSVLYFDDIRSWFSVFSVTKPMWKLQFLICPLLIGPYNTQSDLTFWKKNSHDSVKPGSLPRAHWHKAWWEMLTVSKSEFMEFRFCFTTLTQAENAASTWFLCICEINYRCSLRVEILWVQASN